MSLRGFFFFFPPFSISSKTSRHRVWGSNWTLLCFPPSSSGLGAGLSRGRSKPLFFFPSSRHCARAAARAGPDSLFLLFSLGKSWSKNASLFFPPLFSQSRVATFPYFDQIFPLFFFFNRKPSTLVEAAFLFFFRCFPKREICAF